MTFWSGQATWRWRFCPGLPQRLNLWPLAPLDLLEIVKPGVPPSAPPSAAATPLSTPPSAAATLSPGPAQSELEVAASPASDLPESEVYTLEGPALPESEVCMPEGPALLALGVCELPAPEDITPPGPASSGPVCQPSAKLPVILLPHPRPGRPAHPHPRSPSMPCCRHQTRGRPPELQCRCWSRSRPPELFHLNYFPSATPQSPTAVHDKTLTEGM